MSGRDWLAVYVIFLGPLVLLALVAVVRELRRRRRDRRADAHYRAALTAPSEDEAVRRLRPW